MINRKFWIIIFTIFIINAWFANHAFSASSEALNEIQQREIEIQELEQQIQELAIQIDAKRGESKTLENEVSKLNAQIKQINLEIRRIQININQVNDEIVVTTTEIGKAEETMDKHFAALSQTLRILYQNDQKNLTQIILSNNTLSDFFSNLQNIKTTQDTLWISIKNIKALKKELENTGDSLRGKRLELEQLQFIQEIGKGSVSSIKKEKNSILKQTKGQEAQFQKLIQRSQKDIEAIRAQIYYLEQNGITAEEAVKFAQLAAIRAGIRPAFLLAILEIESGLGRNIGSGNWKDDMYDCYVRLGTIYYPSRKAHYLKRAESEKAAFFTIINKLNLDPNSVKVSAEPNYGCGGAMGPAQFIPTTWLAYEKEVARLTGHNPPSPWSIEDSFMASAIKLANGGANSKTFAGETGASRAYIGGRTTCSSSICNYYANAVQRKAEQIEKNL